MSANFVSANTQPDARRVDTAARYERAQLIAYPAPLFIISRCKKITPSLWFNGQVQEAVEFEISVFDDGRIND